MKLFIAWLAASFVRFVSSKSSLTLPPIVNCGDQAVLTCRSDECRVDGYTFSRDGVPIYNNGGPQPGIDSARYSATVTPATKVLLTITNIQRSDAGVYRCNCGFDEHSDQQTLRYECKASLTLPPIVNCGDQAVLTCTSIECNVEGYGFRRDGVIVYNNDGPQPGADPARYSATVTPASQVLLAITNIQLSDAGTYTCTCGVNNFSAQHTLSYKCKPSNSSVEVTLARKLQITVDRLYPQPSGIVTNLDSYTSQLPGMFTCGPSPKFASHFKCTWNSTASLPDGHYGYTITVTTELKMDPVLGSFTIVTPMSPIISSLSTISNNRLVLLGVQDTPLTIECVSNGGIPAPTLAWYRGSTSTSPIAQSTTSDPVPQSDGTYTVTLIHTFTPGRRDDMTPFLCRVFYPGATTGVSTDPTPASAILYLDLKPDTPTLSQTGEAASGRSMALRCTSNNGRPAPSITWSYQGPPFPPSNNLSYDPTSETYTVVSVLQRPVNATDNGHTVTCIVSHTTLYVPLNATIKVDVKFGPIPDTIAISGNKTEVATGTDKIPLNCTSGSSNPASNITWYNGSDVIPNTESYTRWPGNNNGVISSNILTITPTRYMDGDRITCRTDNGYGSDSTYVDLDILYPPLIQPVPNVTAIEGDHVTLNCAASSKPPANFTWYKGDMVLASGMGTLEDNSFSYRIPRANRTNAGSYRCHAGNNVGSLDLTDIYLVVKYKDSPAVESHTALIPGIVTGVCVPLVIAVVVIIICKRRKAGGKKTTENGGRNLGNASAGSDSVVECAMYESAGHLQQRTPESDLYSKPKKIDKAALTAVPIKLKNELTKAATQKGESVYEYSEATASLRPSKPKKNINEDGLVYADLEFNKNHKKSMIHGLDNATTYVQVDFTKAADPLPDSDEEI